MAASGSPPGLLRYGTPSGSWVLAATALGSGVAFLDGTVVNVALPSIGKSLGASVSGLQWTLDGYLVTLSALLLLGGSLGDLVGRRRLFVVGLIGFLLASMACGVAPHMTALIVARIAQGAAAAFLVPGSLAILSASFHPEDRSRAVGAWSGLAGVAGAVGPFLGGWLVDHFSWRTIFFLNVPLVSAVVWMAMRHVPESRDPQAARPDIAGAAAATLGLGGVAYAAIEGPAGFGPMEIAATVVGVLALATFVVVERTSSHPMVPFSLFRSSQFSGANLTTFAVYAGLSGAMFLVVLELQVSLHYSGLAAGTSLLPLTVIMMLGSSRAGQLAKKIGPRIPMTVGPLVAAAGLFLFARIGEGATYVGTVLPAAIVFGAGMTLTVAPLTAAVLAAADERHIGAASGINNAVARLAGLIAVAVLPAAVGIDPRRGLAEGLAVGFPRALEICAASCALGGLIAFATVRTAREVPKSPPQSPFHPCHGPALASSPPASADTSA